MDTFYAWCASVFSHFTWGNVKDFAESNFVSNLFASLAGAYFGVTAAYKLAERGRLRDVLTAEVENVNAAIHRSHAVFNVFAALKKQHARSLKQAFDTTKSAVLAHQQELANGTVIEPLEVSFDFRVLSPMRVDTVALQTSVLEKTKVRGRPRSIIQTLANSIGSVDDMIIARNDFVMHQRKLDLQPSERVSLVFGLPIAGQIVDTSYGDYVEAIYKCTDDCLYFSRRLCMDLEVYGSKVRKQLLNIARGEVPNVTKVDFSSLADQELLPDIAEYQTWETGFPIVPPTVRYGALRTIWEWKKSEAAKGFATVRAWFSEKFGS